MCFSQPKMPPMKDPVLPKQPLQQQEPVGLQVGRTEDDNKFNNAKASRARKRLRITRDTAGAQVSGAPVGSSGGISGGM